MSQQINLFNPAFEQQKNLLSAAGMAAVGGIAVLAVSAWGYAAHTRTAALQLQANAGAAQLEAAQQRLAAAAGKAVPRGLDTALAAEISDAEARRDALRRVRDVIERGELGNTQGYAEYFRALARQRVEGLWLTGVRIGGAGLDLGVQGRALDPALVPGFLARLRKEPVMQGKPVGSLQIGPAPDLKGVDKEGKETSEPASYVEFSLQSMPVEDKR